MAVRMRKNVWTLPTGDQTLDWYAKAIDVLIKRPITDPTSWRYMAAVHDVPATLSTPSSAQGSWAQCQHQSWFFLPWHRGYITAFEAVIAKTVADLGGPSEWALPYWNYSGPASANPNQRMMPPAFLGANLPNGDPNRLWSRRAQNLNGDFNLDDASVTLDALNALNFIGSAGGGAPGFGGPSTGFSHFGGSNGALENLPHNRIHTRVGGQTGFMTDPATAALDPIFWLHHCNIDRLWEVWRNQPGRNNPKSGQWLTAVSFPLHNGVGAAITINAQDMLDTSKILHGYCYEGTPLAREPTAMVDTPAEDPAEDATELAGAGDGAVDLTDTVTRVTVTLALDRTNFSFTEAEKATPSHVFLSIEGVTGRGFPGDVMVFLEPPNDPETPLLAGVLTTFGLARASDPELEHGGSGVAQTFEITGMADQLGLTDGSATALQVRFERETLEPTEDGAPEDLADMATNDVADPSIQVGMVNLVFS